MTHPKLGRVTLLYSTFQANDNPDLRLVLYTGSHPNRSGW
jgi:hypothetical protein